MYGGKKTEINQFINNNTNGTRKILFRGIEKRKKKQMETKTYKIVGAKQ